MQLRAQGEIDQLEELIRTASAYAPGPNLDNIALENLREHEKEGETPECRLSRPDTYQLLALFESAAHRSYIGSPHSDHRLTLVKLNVFRAFERNISALGYTRKWMTDDAISRFSVCGPLMKETPGSLPTSLQPTALQISQAHHPWLDFFPCAHMRDELIRREDTIDDSQLCRDLMGFWSMPTEADNCMLVWGDPWEPMNWEVTETFLRKWGFLVKNCPEIIWSSNFWRQQRGEQKLKWKVSFNLSL